MSNAFLRLVRNNGINVGQEKSYSLAATSEVAIGREPTSCQIVLDSNLYSTVSRRHASIKPSPTPDGKISYLLCDNNSANGTYLNGSRLQGCQELHPGDLIIFGTNGPEFIFECQLVTPPVTPGFASSTTSVSSAPNNSENASITQLFPALNIIRKADFRRRTYLWPGIITVIFVVMLFSLQSQVNPSTAVLSIFLIATYIALGAYFFVYQLCGKHKPWWVLVGSGVGCILILITPLFYLFTIIFRGILPGSIPNNPDIGFVELFIHMFFGAGLMEELIKALPIFAFMALGNMQTSPTRERIGVSEPLDGILLGSASAVGFTLLETLLQYGPENAARVSQQTGSEAAGILAGLLLVIPRILGTVFGHMAWSGWFGYFIGFSVLKPRQKWQILVIGYLSASLMHALWNSVASISILLLLVVGVLSYACLVGAIVQARALSPTRKENFATQFSSRN
ncbi:MAG: PrsW family intramembrane metalloprotease [Scytonematopsis contorta HA4267-MV1]|jgi:RsiW-degrading membrane proteinase PrsW (M82 family)|nr:PrsW family intramembrane metalloprotease [Scytonematopsis contorta HA4267-MV1]